MTFTPQETEFLVSLLRQVNVNAANPQAQQTIAMTQALLMKLAAPDTAKAGPMPRLSDPLTGSAERIERAMKNRTA